jgi:hypothetical protein
LRLYSHALESDELAAAKRWDDGFAEIVEAHANRMRNQPGRELPSDGCPGAGIALKPRTRN